MSIYSKQRAADLAKQGRDLAEWLNREDSNSTAAKIMQSVADLHQAFPLGVTGFYLPSIGFRARTRDRHNRTTLIPVNLRAEFRPRGRGFAFNSVPADEDSRWLQVFGELCNSGNLSRLRRCPNCGRFWYCEGRIDRGACSVACKVVLWQKTPQGRATKAAYMREYRKKQGERERKQRLTGKRLKASKSILAKLGK